MIVALLLPRLALAIPSDVVAATPGTPLAAVWLDFSTTTPRDAGGGSAAPAFLHMLSEASPAIASKTGWALESLTSLAILSEHPVALVVTDAAAVALPDGGARLANLQLAVIIKTNGDNGPIAAQIQSLLSAHTDPTHSTITESPLRGSTFYTLSDSRLPDWATLTWGPIGGFYIVALGPPAFDASHRAISDPDSGMHRDDWILAAHRRLSGDDALIECTIDLEKIRHRLGKMMAGKPDAVLDSLGLTDVDRVLWTVRMHDRAVITTAVLRRNNEDVLVPISTAAGPADDLRSTVPPSASSYAVIHQPAGKLLSRLSGAYLAAKSPGTRDDIRRLFAELATQANVDFRKDVLDRLADRIIIHTYPQHPLHVPLLCTILIETDGSTNEMRAAVDRLLYAAHARLEASRRDHHTIGNLFSPTIDRDERGTWHIRAGIAGPGIAFAKNWLVISYSPRAVERNLDYLLSPPPTTQDAPE